MRMGVCTCHCLPGFCGRLTVQVTATLEAASVTGRPHFGFLAGKIELAPDFDEPLADLK